VYSLDLRHVQNFPSYAVSRGGVVIRVLNKTGSFKGKVLRQYENQPPTDRHLYVRLSENGRVLKRYVHHLVAETFIGPRPDGGEVNHKDTNPTHNAVSNLEYVTRANNVQHYLRSTKRAKLAAEQSANGWTTPKSQWRKAA
jgi:hypothetical protein